MIITCASSKGGVGKSTAVASLAGAFAHQGEAVHIVDLDNNRTVSRWFRDSATHPHFPSRFRPRTRKSSPPIYRNSRKLPRRTSSSSMWRKNYQRALTVAATRAHLTIIPAALTEADVYEANKTASHIQQIFRRLFRPRTLVPAPAHPSAAACQPCAKTRTARAAPP